MAALSRDQLTQLLINAGFKKNSNTLNTMIGIAYAESGGDPSKYNGVNRDSSYGIWQINMKGDLGPSRRKQFGISSNDQLFDPATNAKAAYIVYKNSGLDAWTTYKNGEYLKHMDQTVEGEGGNNNPIEGVKDKVEDATTGPIAAAISKVGNDIFKIGSSVMYIVIALVVIALGVVILMRNALPAGKAVKAIKAVTK